MMIEELFKVHYSLYVPITMVDRIRESFDSTIKNYNPDEDVIGFKDGKPVTKRFKTNEVYKIIKNKYELIKYRNR